MSWAKRNASHLIAAITFTPRTNDGPMDCTCGEGMLASEFSAHRKANGLTMSMLRVPERERMSPNVWNRVRPK